MREKKLVKLSYYFGNDEMRAEPTRNRSNARKLETKSKESTLQYFPD